jgi:hypothetical protein
MKRKIYTVYKLKKINDALKYVVYKWENGKVQPTYYTNKKLAESSKNWIAA